MKNQFLNVVLENIIVDYLPKSEEHALVIIKQHIDRKGLYAVAKEHDVLVDGSASEFATEFMTEYNNRVEYTY